MHWKHAEGMSLRYGVYVMVLLSLLNLLISCEWCTLLYNIKEAGSFWWGNLLCGGICVGYALFGGVLVVVDYDELADFGGDSQLACCSHE